MQAGELSKIVTAIKEHDDAEGQYPVLDEKEFTKEFFAAVRPDFDPAEWPLVFSVLWSSHCLCGFKTGLHGYRSDVEYDLAYHQENKLCPKGKGYLTKWTKSEGQSRRKTDPSVPSSGRR